MLMFHTREFERFGSIIMTMSNICEEWLNSSFSQDAIDEYHISYKLQREFQIMQYFESSNTSMKYLQPGEFGYNSNMKARWVYTQTKNILDSETPIVSVVALGVDEETSCVVPKAIDIFGVTEVFERLALKTIQTVQNEFDQIRLRAFSKLMIASYNVEIHKIRLLIRYLKGVTKDQYTDEYKILIQKRIKSNKKYRKLVNTYNDRFASFKRIKRSDAEREYDKFINTIKRLCSTKPKTLDKLLKNSSKYQICVGAKLAEIMKTSRDLDDSDMETVLGRIKTICDITPGVTLGTTSYTIISKNLEPCKFSKFIVSFPFESLVYSFFSYYYRFPEDLKKLCIRNWELTVQHEFGHVLSFLDMEQKKTPTTEVVALCDSNDGTLREYDKFCKDAIGNPEISVADINRKYYELSLEKLANKYGCVDPEEYDQIDKAFASYEESIMKKNDKFTWVF